MPYKDGIAMCDTCGKQATIITRDMVRYEHPSLEEVAYGPASEKLNMGCDDHPAPSNEYVSQSLPPWMRKKGI